MLLDFGVHILSTYSVIHVISHCIESTSLLPWGQSCFIITVFKQTVHAGANTWCMATHMYATRANF